MADKETGSEWSHILGEAKAGPLSGQQLTIIPSVMTNWESWLAKYPHTSVTMIERSAREFQTEMLQHSQRFGIGLVHHGQARLWRFDQLRNQPLVNDKLKDLDLVVHYDTKNCTPVMWKRQVNERLLSFQSRDQGVQDAETGSTWDMQRGVATDGPLKGTKLVAAPAIVTFRIAWERFHPDSSTWAPK